MQFRISVLHNSDLYLRLGYKSLGDALNNERPLHRQFPSALVINLDRFFLTLINVGHYLVRKMDSDVLSNNSDEFGNKQPFCDVSEINTPGQLADPGDRIDTSLTGFVCYHFSSDVYKY